MICDASDESLSLTVYNMPQCKTGMRVRNDQTTKERQSRNTSHLLNPCQFWPQVLNLSSGQSGKYRLKLS